MMGSIFSSVYLDLVFMCLLDVYVGCVFSRSSKSYIYIFKMELLIYIFVDFSQRHFMHIYSVCTGVEG